MPSKDEMMKLKNASIKEGLSVLSRQPVTGQSRVTVSAVKGRWTEVRIRSIILIDGQAGKGLPPVV